MKSLASLDRRLSAESPLVFRQGHAFCSSDRVTPHYTGAYATSSSQRELDCTKATTLCNRGVDCTAPIHCIMKTLYWESGLNRSRRYTWILWIYNRDPSTNYHYCTSTPMTPQHTTVSYVLLLTEGEKSWACSVSSTRRRETKGPAATL